MSQRIALIIACVFLYLSPVHACETLVQANDNFATVFVDGRNMGPVPQKVACKDQIQKVIVRSNEGQVFTRMIPQRNQFKQMLHGLWNVVFSEPEQRNLTEQTVVSDKAYSFNGPSSLIKNQKQIMRELYDLKKKIGYGAVTANSPIGRSISSLSKSPSHVLKGHYLQLHAFKGSQWNFQQIAADLQPLSTGPLVQRLQFCLKEKLHNQKWTRVLWGPFQSKNAARVAANKIDRPTILRSHPRCRVN